MRVPQDLAHAFELHFENEISRFLAEQGYFPAGESLSSPRTLARSIAPHISKLSRLFNRMDDLAAGPEQGGYWKSGSNARNLRLAYFLGYMPPNLFRIASVWAELARLGYRWPSRGPVRALDLGCGPATAACGVAAGERYASLGLPETGNWALVDRDRAILDLGAAWAQDYRRFLGLPEWDHRKYAKKLEPGQLLPPSAPRFHLWVQSYFLNELGAESPGDLAATLLRTWQRHLEEEGLVIWVEPALKGESRKLLEVRKELISRLQEPGASRMQILLPCLGHQTCGALAAPEDWCHEESVWWRPPYLRKLDEMTGLDHKSLPFSYLVLARSGRRREELLPALAGARSAHRLVSPSHPEGRDQEFFTCGQEGKRRTRLKTEEELERGDILLDAELRGDPNSSRVEKHRGRV